MENCLTEGSEKCFMSEEIKEIAKELVDVGNNVNAIKRALLGVDGDFKSTGLIDEVRVLKSQVADLQRNKWFVVGFASAVSSGITIAISLFF